MGVFFRSECRENFSLFHSVFILCVSRNHWSCCLIPIAAQCVQGVFSDNHSSFCSIFTVCPLFSISTLCPGGPQNLVVQAFLLEYLFLPDDSIVAILKFLACRAFFPPRRGCAAGRPEFGLFDQKGRKTRIRVFRHFPLIRFSGGVRPSWSKSLNSGFSTFLVENLEFGFFDHFGRKTRIRVFRPFSLVRFFGGVRPFWSKNPNSGFSVILVEKPEFGFPIATRSSVPCSDALCLLEDRVLLVVLLPWGMELPAISSEVPSRVFFVLHRSGGWRGFLLSWVSLASCLTRV